MLSGAAAALSAPTHAAPARTVVKPPRLREGDTVGLIAPGGVIEEKRVARYVGNLESLGLKVKLGRNLLAARGGYAGTVDQRLDDLHAMFRDPDVAGIWSARGGSGAAALLPRIDYKLVRAHPKAFIGYSNTTMLHLALYRHAGIVTFHGPVASSTFSEFSVRHMRAVLMEPRSGLVLEAAPENVEKARTQRQFQVRTFRGGVAQGRLVGGNLTDLCALVGTPYGPVTRDHLLFLEDIGEAPYRIDRSLTQLQLAGLLGQAAGIVLGVFDKCEPPDDEPSLSLAEVLEDRLGDARVPAGYGYSFGHIEQQFTLPIGVRARFDADARTITLLEPAVT